MTIEQFRIAIPDQRLDDMRARLKSASWPGDFGNEQWRYGVEQGWLQDMVRYWTEDYDWRAQEAEINRFPHFRTTIDGVPIHFIHVKSGKPDAIPLILTHGWPWTFWDWNALIEPLVAGGDGVPSFDIVVPSLPGVAFSAPLQTAGIGLRRIAAMWVELMERLGYERFAAAGGDWGGGVTAELGHAHADRLIAIYMSLVLLPGLDPSSISPEDFAPDEAWMLERTMDRLPTIVSHVSVQSSDPQTLAYALADSPVGTAAWLWERRRNWSDCNDDVLAAYDRDFLCTTASIYWLTNTIGSSLRIYKEMFTGMGFAMDWPLAHDGSPPIPVPTGVGVARKDVAFVPRAIVERHTNLQRWQVIDEGGHFLPAERPQTLVDEYRTFFAGAR